MNKSALLLLVILASLVLIFGKIILTPNQKEAVQKTVQIDKPNPLSIEAMRQKNYPGSNLIIDQTLEDGSTPIGSGSNYHQYIASYMSDGLKIYGLLTVPIKGDKFPAIVFNHGYIPPKQYRTTERYVGYVDAFAKSGYIVFKPDYRGNGNSQGQPEGAYYSPAYTEDVLNAVASLKKYSGVDPEKVGMWGHSMGGNITLRSLVVKPQDIKAAVIWGGVVGTYDDLMNNWQRRVIYQPPANELALRNRFRADLTAKNGTPKTNPLFWNSIDPNNFLSDISSPIQLHVGSDDEEVPSVFSQNLFDRLKKLNKTVEFYSYLGGDHNISEPNFSLAIQRSVEFFDKYLKN